MTRMVTFREDTMLQPLLTQIITMLFYAVLGFLLSKAHLIRGVQSEGLSVICIYLAIPCAILTAFQQDYSPALLQSLLHAVLIILALHAVLLALYFFVLRKGLKLTPTEGVCMIYPNCGNMIIPLVTAMLGTDYVVFICPFIAIQMIFIWIHGVSALTGRKSANVKVVLTNPCTIASIAGLGMFLLNWKMPPFLYSICSTLGSFTAPLAMIVAGVLLGDLDWKQLKAFRRLPLMVVLRLIAIPLTMLCVIHLMQTATTGIVDPHIYMICFMSLTTPTAATMVQLAQLFTDDAHYVSCISSIAMIFSLITIPIMMSLYFAW